MSYGPRKGHAALRLGRWSEPHSDYFLTLCTAQKSTGLTTAVIPAAIWAQVEDMEMDGCWQLRCGVIMPDHLHLLVQLGERLALSRCIQRLKAKTSAVLDHSGISWERGYFDHRLRNREKVTPIIRYIFVPIGQDWSASIPCGRISGAGLMIGSGFARY
jgi:REP element-mobilizing transposase RayT